MARIVTEFQDSNHVLKVHTDTYNSKHKASVSKYND